MVFFILWHNYTCTQLLHNPNAKLITWSDHSPVSITIEDTTLIPHLPVESKKYSSYAITSIWGRSEVTPGRFLPPCPALMRV